MICIELSITDSWDIVRSCFARWKHPKFPQLADSLAPCAEPVLQIGGAGQQAQASRLLSTASLIVFSITTIAGCSSSPQGAPSSPDKPAPGPPLTVMVVDDPELAAAIERQWTARAEGELRLVQTTSAELTGQERIPADAVIFPSGLLGDLAERNMITPIPETTVNGSEFARRDIFDLIRQSEIAWGEQIYAVPLGSPVLTLLYRADIFEQAGLRAPDTWQQYRELAEELAALNAAGELSPSPEASWRPVVEPLGDGWASQILLARAAAYARHRNYYSTLFDSQTMEPLIAGPPFVRALEELVAVNRGEPAEVLEFGPADARRELTTGSCAMAITWPSRSDESSDAADQTPVLPLAAAELPRSTEVYNLGDQAWQTRETSDDGRVTLLGVAGRIGAVSSAARQPQGALSLLLNLSSTEWSEQISPFSPATSLYRTSQLPIAASWLGRDFEADHDYGELVKEIQRRSLWLTSVRIPGRNRYLSALDDAVQQAVLRDAKPADCLERAAEQWRAITEELGVEAQRTAYWRSLGMEP